MEYQVVSEQDRSKLETKVNELIREGWKPQGGVCVTGVMARWFYQAMVKEG